MFAIGVAAIGVCTGCGKPSEPERFGQVAAQIYHCDQDLTIKAMPARDVQKVWPGALAVERVVCGKDVGDADTMIHVATYPSAEAAAKVAADLHWLVPVCLHGHTLIGSLMYPANDYADEEKAAKLAVSWAREFCKRIGGRAIRQR
jgi:hypothetical protein